MYLTVKTIHISLVAVSVIIFFSRGIMMLLKNPMYRHRIFRFIPPVVDTLLMVSGIALMLLIEQYPANQPWLMVKLSALIIYIILGILALNRIDNFRIQMFSFIAASLTILFMYSLARTHQPLGWAWSFFV